MNGWYVAFVRTGKELDCVSILNEIGVEAYTPLKVIKKRSRHGEKISECVAAFNGYLFAKGDADIIKSKRFVLCLIRNHIGEPLIASDDDIIKIMRREIAGEFNEKCIDPVTFNIGDLVIVAEGAAEGKTGTISEMGNIHIHEWNRSVKIDHSKLRMTNGRPG